MSLVTPINYWRTVLKKSADLVIVGVTFDSKMIFEKQLLKDSYLVEVLEGVR